MFIVLDTSCISAFILTEKVELLLELLGEHKIILTEQVFQELKLSKIDSLKNFKHSEIEIKTAESIIANKHNLHIGEGSVIMFAKENNALAVIDDKKARKAAQIEGINFIGTATLIKIGKEKRIIKKTEIEDLIKQITKIGKLYLSEEIKEWIIE